MKIFLKICIGILAILGVLFIILSVNAMFMAGRTRRPETHSLANMSTAGTAAQVYAAKMKDKTGKGSYPTGDSSEIAKAIIETGILSDADIFNDNGEMVDSWGTPLYFVSTGQELCIISWGEDRKRSCFDNHIIVLPLPRAALEEK